MMFNKTAQFEPRSSQYMFRKLLLHEPDRWLHCVKNLRNLSLWKPLRFEKCSVCGWYLKQWSRI